MRNFSIFVFVLLASAPGFAAPKYTLHKTVSAPGEGGWDYLIVDESDRRVYISHSQQVEVMDADTFELVGKIADTKGVHGIALATDLGHGYTSNGRANTVTIFDLKTLKPLGELKTGKNPDSIIYDPSSKRVFAFNGGDKTATVIDAAQQKVIGTIELEGKPESPAVDGAGNLFVTIEDKSKLAKIDTHKLKVLENWPLAPGETAVGLAIDTKNKRLFVGCRNKLLVVVNAENGKVLAKQPIGERVDATAFDPATGDIFCSCGDGTVTVIRDGGGDQYSVVETIKTKVGSKTMALDRKTTISFCPRRITSLGPHPNRGPP